jgi:hypothetical protein
VSGKVLLDGKPIEGVMVQFLNKTSPRTAMGVTDASGQFKLTTYDTNDGAVVGDHIVTMTKQGSGGAMNAELPSPAVNPEEWKKQYEEKMFKSRQQGPVPSQLPSKYGDPKTSGISRQVIEGDPNVFTFELTSQ